MPFVHCFYLIMYLVYFSINIYYYTNIIVVLITVHIEEENKMFKC